MKNNQKSSVTVNKYSVYTVLDALKLDYEHFEVMFSYDKDEIFATDAQFNKELTDSQTTQATRLTSRTLDTVVRNYVLIRCIDTKRAIIKLWGHKDSVTVEICKSLKNRKEYCVDKKVYTNENVSLDRNQNYICKTKATAVNMCSDFLKQVSKNLNYSVTVSKLSDNLSEAK